MKKIVITIAVFIVGMLLFCGCDGIASKEITNTEKSPMVQIGTNIYLYRILLKYESYNSHYVYLLVDSTGQLISTQTSTHFTVSNGKTSTPVDITIH